MHALAVTLIDGVAVAVGDRSRAVERRREQALLARLALNPGRALPLSVLISDIWGDEPPPTAVDALRVHVSALRKLLAEVGARDDVLHTGTGTYTLDVSADAVDVARIEAAIAAGDVERLRPFVHAWAGTDLASLDSGSGFFEAAARHLAELRLTAVELVAAQQLAVGPADDVVPLLERALHEGPYRERLWELLVTALSSAERRAEAARAYQRAREALADVGVAPGPALRATETRIFAEMAATRRRRPVTEYVDVDGSRIAHATIGDGELDLLFVHGGFVPFETMGDDPRLARFIDELAARYRVIVLDRRGIGMSDPPADGAPVEVAHWVADCRAVLDAVRSRRAVVFAHENAGPMAICLAAEAPDRVAGLVLHSTAARPLRAPDHPYGPSEEAFERIERMIDGVQGDPDMVQLVAPSAGDDDGLRVWLERAGRLGAGPARARELHRTYLHADVRSVLGRVRAPAIVLHPARLARADPGQASYLADRLAGAELEMLDSADHLFWLADADRVLAAIHRLCQRAGPAVPDRAVRLRAIVAVIAPDGDVPDLDGQIDRLDPGSGALVVTFGSLAAAQLAADLLRRSVPGSTVVVDTADTTGAVEDEAVQRLLAVARDAADARLG